jgi:hypothetical protein
MAGLAGKRRTGETQTGKAEAEDVGENSDKSGSKGGGMSRELGEGVCGGARCEA